MLDIVQLFRAKVIDVAPDAMTIQITGNAGKIADFRRMLEPFGIRELVQSGMVAIGRGPRSISERSLRPVAVPAPAAGRAPPAAHRLSPAPHHPDVPTCTPTPKESPPWLRCSTTTTPTCP